MATRVYLIRHAQSHISSEVPDPEWPLSSAGAGQATRLAELLQPLGIRKIFSSPYRRCISTMTPFSLLAGTEIVKDERLRERIVAPGLRRDFQEVWARSWEDFAFALPGCETSWDAQRRFVAAVGEIGSREVGPIAICTHGNVIGLLLNHLDSAWGRHETDRLRNPDVVKFEVSQAGFFWDRGFALAGMDEIASGYHETPIEW